MLTPMENLSPLLIQNRRHLERLLHMPGNAGIEARQLVLESSPPREALLVWVDGLVAAESLALNVVAPLAALRGEVTPEKLARELLMQCAYRTTRPDEVVRGICNGHAALLIDGWAEAWMLDGAIQPQHHIGWASPDPNVELFATDLRVNVSLVRKRLRTPDLVARRVKLRNGKHGQVALLYQAGRARPELIRRVHRWVREHAGEEESTRGSLAGARAVFGLLPRFGVCSFPDTASTFLENGHVVVVTDRSFYAGVAPVTAASWLLAPGSQLRYPLRRWLSRVRILFYMITLLLPGTVVALMNYHHEMVPTSFLLSVASARENAPFGIFFEVAFLEGMVEIAREATFRLPVSVPIGASTVSICLLALLGVLTGFVGPVPALAAALGALASLALPSYEGTFLVRVWRAYLLLAATILGFFGMAAAFGVLVTYLSQASSWGVPFLGPAGWEFQNQEADAARPPKSNGGKSRAKSGLLLR